MTRSVTIPAEDGFYAGVDEESYHQDPTSLSCSQAKDLLKSPFRFNWKRSQPVERKTYFDLGSYVHTKVLGVGQPIVVIDAPDFKTKAAREERDKAYAARSVPILASAAQVGDAMAEQLLAHPTAGKLLNNEARRVEESGYWHDEATGLRLRCRPDLAVEIGDWLVVLDVKTTSKSASPKVFPKTAAELGYHIQDAWYTAGLIAAGQAEQVDFVFAVVETEPPHMVSLNRLTPRARDLGAAKMRQAINLYAECTANDHWPDYGDDIHTIDLPAWHYYQEEE